MNICMIVSIPIPPKEGIGNYVYNLSKQLKKKGNNVLIITRGNHKNPSVERFSGFQILKIPFLPVYPFHLHLHSLFLNKIIKHLKDVDLFHLHSPLVPPVSANAPTVVTFHTPMKSDIRNVELLNINALAIKLQGFFSYSTETKILSSNYGLSAVSTSVAEELGEYGIELGKVNIIPNGVDDEYFIPAKRKGVNFPYILYVGRLSYRKGLLDLIESSKYLCKKNAEIKIIIVGDGPLKYLIQKEITKYNLNDRIILLGYISKKQLLMLYQNATMCVVPSHYEGLPGVLLEAMACGCPVIASAVSGIPEVVDPGKNGILIPPKSPLLLTDSITTLLNDSSKRNFLSRNARVTIEERYSWKRIVNKLIYFYNDNI